MLIGMAPDRRVSCTQIGVARHAYWHGLCMLNGLAHAC